MAEYIYCSNCNKKIEKKGQRTLCIKCTNLMDRIRIRQRTQTEEYKQQQREKYLAKKERLI